MTCFHVGFEQEAKRREEERAVMFQERKKAISRHNDQVPHPQQRGSFLFAPPTHVLHPSPSMSSTHPNPCPPPPVLSPLGYHVVHSRGLPPLGYYPAFTHSPGLPPLVHLGYLLSSLPHPSCQYQPSSLSWNSCCSSHSLIPPLVTLPHPSRYRRSSTSLVTLVLPLDALPVG